MTHAIRGKEDKGDPERPIVITLVHYGRNTSTNIVMEDTKDAIKM